MVRVASLAAWLLLAPVVCVAQSLNLHFVDQDNRTYAVQAAS